MFERSNHTGFRSAGIRFILYSLLIVMALILVSPPGHAASDNGSLPTQQARQWNLFNYLSGVAVDQQGNVYVADYYNSMVKKVYPNGTVTILADSISLPYDVAVDSKNDVYVTSKEEYDNKLDKIYPNGTVVTLGEYLADVSGVDVDSQDNVYVAFSYYGNYLVDELCTNGSVVTLANNFTSISAVAVDRAGNVYLTECTSPGTVKKISNGTVTVINSSLLYPEGVAVDSLGNVYISDAYNSVKKIYPNGSAITVSNTFSSPMGLAVDSTDAVFVADQNNYVVKKIYPNGTIVSLGSSFDSPYGGAIDAQGNVFVSDTKNGEVKEIYANGSIVTRASGMTHPWGIVNDTTGNLYVVDYIDGVVKKITPSGAVTTPASGFSYPGGIAIDATGNLYVADSGNNVIEKITPAGAVTQWGSGFNSPYGVAVDSSGNIYVADTSNNEVDKIYTNGTTVVLAGTPLYNSEFNYPYSVAVDTQGLVYVADFGHNAVKVIYPDGSVATLISGLHNPGSVSINAEGHLCVIDSNAITEYVPATPVPSLVANFTSNVSSGMVPLTVLFNDTSSGGPQSWNWSFGDGSANVTARNTTHTFNASGSYTVLLTVKNGSLMSTKSGLITVTAGVPNASYIGNSIPNTMVASNTYNVSITYTNNGNTNWTSGKGDELVLWGQLWAFTMDNTTSVNGYPAYSLPAGITVLPGQSYSWNFSLTPIWSGSYGLGFQMTQTSTNTWLGTANSKSMITYAPAPNASLVVTTIPDVMVETNAYNVSITYSNTGNTSWTSGKGDKVVMWGQLYAFSISNDTAVSGYPAFNIPAGVTIQPGQSYTWNFSLTPIWSGSYGLGFQVVQTSTNSWLGIYSNKVMTITPGAPNALYVSNSIPANMTVGTLYAARVNFTNTGNTTWTSGKGDKLVMWGASSLGLNNDTSAYGYPAYSIPAGITVLPGQTYSWSIAMTPTSAGNSSAGFQVVQTSTNTWMGNSGGKTINTG